jgi:hypothetical protein
MAGGDLLVLVAFQTVARGRLLSTSDPRLSAQGVIPQGSVAALLRPAQLPQNDRNGQAWSRDTRRSSHGQSRRREVLRTGSAQAGRGQSRAARWAKVSRSGRRPPTRGARVTSWIWATAHWPHGHGGVGR